MKPFLYLLLAAGLLLQLPSFAASEDPVVPYSAPDLKLVYSGNLLNLYTSGVRLNMGRNPKAGVWNVPARMPIEMWVHRRGTPGMVRLHPHHYQRQLLELLPDFPEVHNYISDKEFLYKKLDEEIEQLDDHVAKVLEVRKEQQRLRPDRERIIGK